MSSSVDGTTRRFSFGILLAASDVLQTSSDDNAQVQETRIECSAAAANTQVHLLAAVIPPCKVTHLSGSTIALTLLKGAQSPSMKIHQQRGGSTRVLVRCCWLPRVAWYALPVVLLHTWLNMILRIAIWVHPRWTRVQVLSSEPYR